LVENRNFSYPAFEALVRRSPSEYWHTVWDEKKWNGAATRWIKKFEDRCSHFARIPACDRRTDGHLTTV